MNAQPLDEFVTLAVKGKTIYGRVNLPTGVRHALNLYRPGMTVTAPDQDFRVRLGPRQPIQFGKRVCS